MTTEDSAPLRPAATLPGPRVESAVAAATSTGLITTTAPTTAPAIATAAATATATTAPAAVRADAPPSAPVGLTVTALGVFDASVVPVGILASGEMEVPATHEAGWYRHGARPGRPGSAVLAAHVAFGGEAGLFAYLDRVRPGDEISVTHADGSATAWVVATVEQHAKDALPIDRVFASGGPPTLVLVTCGGLFNATLRTYADNLVVFARSAAVD